MSNSAVSGSTAAASKPKAGPSDDGEGFTEVRRRNRRPQNPVAATSGEGEGSTEARRRYRCPRKRPSGAEVKRRRKARELESRVTSATTAGGADKAPQRPQTLGARAYQPQPSRMVEARPSQPKRQRSATSSEPTPRGAKRARQEAQGKSAPRSFKSDYKGAITSHLKVAVINGCNQLGKLDEKEAEAIRVHLTEQLVELVCNKKPDDNTPSPTFSSMVYAGQILKIDCTDDLSLEWIKATISKLPPIEGLQPNVIREKDLPTLSRVQIWIPRVGVDVRSHEDTLRMLAGQNKHLDVANWCLFRHEQMADPPGRLFVFGVGLKDATWLKANEGKLYYLFNTLRARVGRLKDPEKQEQRVGDNEPAEQMETAEIPSAKEADDIGVNLDADPATPAPLETLDESILDSPTVELQTVAGITFEPK